MTKKSSTPAIRFKGFTDTWEQRKLGDVVKEITRNDPESEAPIMMITANNGFIEQSERYAFNNAGESLKKYILLKKGELAYNHGASKLRPYGSCFALTTAENARIPFVYHCFSAENQNAEFMSIELNDAEIENQLRKIVSSGARMDGLLNISFDEYTSVSVLLPGTEEQDRIADFFRHLDNLITLHQRKYEKLHNIKKSMLEKMFPKNGSNVPEIRFKGFTEAWEQRKLGDVATFINGRAYSQPELLSSGKYKVLRVGNFYTNDSWYYSDLELGEKYYADYGDLLYTWSATFGPHIWLGDRVIYHYHIWKIDLSNQLEKQFAVQLLEQDKANILSSKNGSTMVHITKEGMEQKDVIIPPSTKEQQEIGAFFQQLDNLITLHQRKHFLILEDIMLNNINKTDLFYDYYAQWITVYKEGAIRKVTMDKYLLTQSWIKQLAPELRVCELSRITYQKLLNDYAKSHERQTTMDFHHQLKGAVLDAVDEGLIERDPTRKAIIKGKKPRHKKIKYLNQFELHKLLSNLDLGQEINWDWFILLVAKTGMRFSEALAITPKDFDFSKQSLSINKTWDYKGEGGFMPTKNQSSVRKIQIDWQLIIQFSTLVKDLPEDEPIFVSGKVYNSTVNDILERHCKKAEIPVISIHGLRHTHASLLLFAGVSIASVAQRLGHSSMTTTQKTYLHIIQELENKDVDLVMRSLSSLN